MSDPSPPNPPEGSYTYTMTNLKLKPKDRNVECYIDGIISTYNLIKLQDELKKIEGYRFILKCEVIAE